MSMIICKECGKEFSDKAPACPNCACPNENIKNEVNTSAPAKNKKKRGCCSTFLFAFLIIVILVAILGNTDSKETDKSNNKVEEKENVVIEYKKVDADTLIELLDSNALKAEKEYQDAYLEVTGKLSVIDSDGKYISISSSDPFSFMGIQCYIKNESQLNKVLEMEVGDVIVVKGQISEIGEVLGYTMDIDDLYISK